jgi:hypothetical protein
VDRSVSLENATHDPGRRPQLLSLFSRRSCRLNFGAVLQRHGCGVTDNRHVEVCLEKVLLVLEAGVHGFDCDD